MEPEWSTRMGHSHSAFVRATRGSKRGEQPRACLHADCLARKKRQSNDGASARSAAEHTIRRRSPEREPLDVQQRLEQTSLAMALQNASALHGAIVARAARLRAPVTDGMAHTEARDGGMCSIRARYAHDTCVCYVRSMCALRVWRESDTSVACDRYARGACVMRA